MKAPEAGFFVGEVQGEGYGNLEYVPHVIWYYSERNLFAELFGNSQIVSVVMAKLGNEGGQKF